MKTFQELKNKWDGIDRGTMSRAQEKLFVNDWYNLGKHLPTKPFEPNFSDYEKYKGQTFTIVDIVDTSETELDCLPLWKIRMLDDNVIWADCDEIFDFNDLE